MSGWILCINHKCSGEELEHILTNGSPAIFQMVPGLLFLNGATSQDFSPPTTNLGTTYYRVTLISNGAACNNSRGCCTNKCKSSPCSYGWKRRFSPVCHFNTKPYCRWWYFLQLDRSKRIHFNLTEPVYNKRYYGRYRNLYRNCHKRCRCSEEATVDVIINALPVPTAGSNSPQCTGSTLNLTAAGEDILQLDRAKRIHFNITEPVYNKRYYGRYRNLYRNCHKRCRVFRGGYS